MKDQYTVDKHSANHNGMIFTVKNYTPNLQSEDRADAKRMIEERLYAVFGKYIKN